MNMEKIFDLLNENRITHLSTITDNFEPRVRPFAIAHIDKNGIYFFTGSFKEVFQQLLKNTTIEFSSVVDQTVSIRIRGNISPENNNEVWEKISSLNPDIVNLYKDNLKSLKLFKMEHGDVNYLDLKTGSLEPIKLKF